MFDFWKLSLSNQGNKRSLYKAGISRNPRIDRSWVHQDFQYNEGSLCIECNRNMLIHIPCRSIWSNLHMGDTIHRHLIRTFCIVECRNWLQMDHQGMEYIYDIVHMVRSTCIRCSLHNYPTLEHFPIQMLWKNMIRKKLNKAFDIKIIPWYETMQIINLLNGFFFSTLAAQSLTRFPISLKL